jgi:hypothetical protein
MAIDMEETPPCGICQLPILQNQAKAELYCFHRVHTTCLQGEVDVNPDDAFVCFVCNAVNLQRIEELQQVLQQEQEEEPRDEVVEGPAHPEHGEPVLLNPEEGGQQPPVNRLRTRERIRLCLQENPEYKRHLQAYIKTRSEISAAHNELAKAIRLKKDPIRAEVLLLKHQIEEHINRLKEQIRQGQEFKTLRSKSSKLGALQRKIEREFHEDFYDIRRALRDQPGLRRLQSSWRLWYHSPSRVMRRAFYFRLRF